jgi:hypothetical protein
LFASTSGSPEARRLQLLDGVPDVIGYYAEGSAALAADFYDDERERAGVAQSYVTTSVINDRVVKIRRGIAWAAEPLFVGEDAATPDRLAEIVQLESARPFRDTITTNRQQDPQATGWKRVTSGGCAFCRMLASRGAVYREASVHFASHPNCHCTAAPVFRTGESGPEASAIQYKASRRSRTPAQRAELRQYLKDNFGE